jgi:hypothetical protein
LCWLWAFKSKQAGTGVFTVKALEYIQLHYAKAESIFMDSWLHFNCAEVTEWCQLHGVDHEFSPEYAPWVNSLVEGHNNILLDQLKWACMGDEETPTKDEMKKWPDHFKGAVGMLNNYKRGITGFIPRQLLFTLAGPGVARISAEELEEEDIEAHLVFADEICWDAIRQAMETQAKCKARYGRRVKECIFQHGDLVMSYNPRWESTHVRERKLARRWLGPWRIIDIRGTSFKLETLEGLAPTKEETRELMEREEEEEHHVVSERVVT